MAIPSYESTGFGTAADFESPLRTAAGGGGGFNPLSMLTGVPPLHLQGGDAAPSAARADGSQTVNSWMFSPFAVGPGATAASNVPIGQGSAAGAPPAITQASIPLIAIAALFAVVLLVRK